MKKRDFKKAKKIWAEYLDGGKGDQQRLKKVWEQNKDKVGITQTIVKDTMQIKAVSAVNHYINGRIPLNLEIIIVFALLLEVDIGEISPKSKTLIENLL
tara:strand:- start:1547 stop:1843 length:297 start_codon:yes stop_codon:yes gene_type:complete